MKKILALVLSLCALFCVSSCGEEAKSTENAPSDTPSSLVSEESKEEKAYARLLDFVKTKSVHLEKPEENKGSGKGVPSFEYCYFGMDKYMTGPETSEPIYIYIGIVEDELYFTVESARGQSNFIFGEEGTTLLATTFKKNCFDCEEFAERGGRIDGDPIFNQKHVVEFELSVNEARYELLRAMERVDKLLKDAGAGVSFADLGYRYVPSIGLAV